MSVGYANTDANRGLREGGAVETDPHEKRTKSAVPFVHSEQGGREDPSNAA